MIGRFILVLTLVALLVSLVLSFGPPRPLAAQDLLPTPVGHLGGPMPLPTAPGLISGSLLQNTPVPAGHPLFGTWLLAFERDLAPAQVVFSEDGLVMFTDALGNRGSGAWIPGGELSGVLAVVVREVDESDRPQQITILQGRIDVDTSGDAATLAYTIETVEESGATANRSGPFTAAGQRVGAGVEVPTAE
jgi:hypothetical protein